MDKLKMQSHDVTGSNINKIARLFPNCVTERLGKNGKLELAIDFEKLEAELSNDILAEGEERYQFTWPDKRAANRLANTPTTMTLRPCREDSVDFDNTQNLYIEGDNLDVLKVLRETYLGKVKMIYIDPPYNTGNDFVYNDEFAQSKSEFEQNSGLFDEEGNQTIDPMLRNTESNGRFHTDWLNMIYPRLKVARDLLTDAGVIFISLDDKEVANLVKICTEIFGERNFVGNIIWQSRTSISNDDEISTNHNHTLVYSKNREQLTFGGDDIDASEYVNLDNDPRGPWKLVPIDANHIGGDTNYPIRNPKTGVDYYPPNGRIWCYNKQTLESLMEDGRIKFGLTDDSSPKRKLFLNERKAKGDCKTPSSILLDAGTTKSGTSEIMSLFENEKVFDYPKPTTLITRLMKYGYLNNDDIIMDFFSGSGTTAHASFAYNIKENKKVKFLLVQMPENLERNLQTAANDAKKSMRFAINMLDSIAKPHFLTEIAKERIRRAGKKIREENADKEGINKLDTGFRVLKLDSSNMEDIYYTPQEFDDQSLFHENVKPDRSSEDLLFSVMLDLGMELSAKMETRQMAGKNVHFVDGNYLIACFDKDVNESAITEIARMKPVYFVMRDASAANDNVIDNFEQIFRHYSPDTNCRIL
ncbi:site-specific DNA-methyltransferase [Akkermansia muciniphila]|uniref:site-specific DNA-methyltransferase n=1 Tax=Akkermansia muciniphila TaxID=239935 RepID=UPI0015FFF26D|nr:site-specific DNA-methyltransferase [Akkermansia muciniphila]QNB43786.1 site-specific DNA-methyltransferase [Akkermansia muciniphila]